MVIIPKISDIMMGWDVLEERKTEQQKLKFWQYPSVVVTPYFHGMTVIEAQNGAEPLIGHTFPWYRIWIQRVNSQTYVRLLNEKCELIKIDGKRVQTKFKGKDKTIGRLQNRAVYKWANESNDPIPFEPVEDSRLGWGIVFAVMLSGCLFLSIKTILFFGPVLQPTQSMPFRVIALILAAQLLAVGALVFFWNIRPRKRSFADIDLLPTGIVGTTPDSEVMALVFADLESIKVKKGNPIRCKMKTAEGRVQWMVLRHPINKFVTNAIDPSNETPREITARTVREMYRQGVRMFILGFALAGLSHALVNYLGSSGAILPNQIHGVYRAVIGSSLLYSWGLGLIYFWVAWKHSSRGQRTIKTVKKRFSNLKDTPKNTTP